MTASPRLERRDWLELLLYWALGCGCSFSLLVLLLHTVLEPQLQGESGLRLSRSIRLVEKVLEELPPERMPPGVTLIRSSAGPEGRDDSLSGFDRELQQRLASQYGLARRLQRDRPPFVDPWGGYWIQLQVRGQSPPLWLYQPERLSSSSAWFLPLLRSGSVFLGVLLGTIGFLHSRVERPFDRMLHSLPDTVSAPLPLLPERGIAPLRLLSLRINRLLERINDAEAARRALLRGLAHDLAGPQTRLLLQLETLEARLPPEGQTMARGCLADLQQLSSLTEQLTLLADREGPPTQIRQIALDDCCRRIADSYPGGPVVVAMPRLLVHLDVLGLERALRNLIDNALDHGLPPVRLAARRHGTTLRLEVEDHGPGLATLTGRTITAPPPAHDRQRRRHRGFGLEIVERFCRENGGDLQLGSSPLGGLQASILLRPTTTNPLWP